jgi:hypothetical protein
MKMKMKMIKAKNEEREDCTNQAEAGGGEVVPPEADCLKMLHRQKCHQARKAVAIKPSDRVHVNVGLVNALIVLELPGWRAGT